MSPGSRNAPLTISFARQDKIEKWIIPDERAAGFIALGIAQKKNEPVVLCCTSGTAMLNYAPAIAEAFYREIPLIVLSADRPPDLIDQRDGQTIRQFEALKNHVKQSFQLPLIVSDESSESYQANLIEGIETSQLLPKGPVHLNIPFSEPFYPTDSDQLVFSPVELSMTQEEENPLANIEFTDARKVLIVVGQRHSDKELSDLLKPIADKIPIIASPLSNITIGIAHVDGFIDSQEDLKPDLLITCGLSVLSKKLKNFIRKHTPKRHLHFDPAGIEVDTYQSSPELIKGDIESILPKLKDIDVDLNYLVKWEELAKKTKEALENFMQKADYSETTSSHHILKNIPKESCLHLSNSMPVRFADLYAVPGSVEVFCNRGTSGIDGCTSTAFGTALVSSRLNILITGDLAFLYDRNAFFHNYDAANLRIIVMNNSGGGIFRLIDGPSKLPELEDYFETKHNRTAEYICKENELTYIRIDSDTQLKNSLSEFWKPSTSAKVMEVFTAPETNQITYKKLRKHINEHIRNQVAKG